MSLSVPKNAAGVWNRLRINGASLPGIIQEISVGGSLRMDTESVAGVDGVVIGNADWSEDTAAFELLVPSTEIKRIQEFRTAYKNKPGIKPTPVVIDHPLLREMGIQKMILVKLEIKWNSSMKNTVPVHVELTNITPKKDKAVTGTRADGTIAPTNPAGSGTAGSGSFTTPPASSKPGGTGLVESNEITGQPTVTQLAKPTAPGPKR